MQIYPVEAEPMPTPAPGLVSPTGLTDEAGARMFRVVYTRSGLGHTMWKVDVMADSALDAIRAVTYAETIPAEYVVGVMDLATLR